jgi:hypothetical protein
MIDGNDKDHEYAVVNGEDRPEAADATGIDRYVLVTLEFLDACLRVFFRGKIV